MIVCVGRKSASAMTRVCISGGGLTFYTAVLDRIIVVPYAVAEMEGEVRLLVRLDAALYHGRRHSRGRRCRVTSLLVATTKKQDRVCVYTHQRSHTLQTRRVMKEASFAG